MPAPIFIGDEVSATAYRLAGARTRVPHTDEVDAVLHWACAESDLVLITAEYAQRLPPNELLRAQAELHPLVLVVPDIRDHVPPPDLVKELRGQLGIEI
jgi:vacuolar-type H+-ATPase subunit F/Vma7